MKIRTRPPLEGGHPVDVKNITCVSRRGEVGKLQGAETDGRGRLAVSHLFRRLGKRQIDHVADRCGRPVAGLEGLAVAATNGAEGRVPQFDAIGITCRPRRRKHAGNMQRLPVVGAIDDLLCTEIAHPLAQRREIRRAVKRSAVALLKKQRWRIVWKSVPGDIHDKSTVALPSELAGNEVGKHGRDFGMRIAFPLEQVEMRP
nr:hypothetical protein FA04_03075 [Ensifer adhaerens]